MGTEYIKVRAGRRWGLARPIAGQKGAFKIIAHFDDESELDRVQIIMNEGQQVDRRPDTAPLKAAA